MYNGAEVKDNTADANDLGIDVKTRGAIQAQQLLPLAIKKHIFL
jgi:hypothetical protein